MTSSLQPVIGLSVFFHFRLRESPYRRRQSLTQNGFNVTRTMYSRESRSTNQEEFIEYILIHWHKHETVQKIIAFHFSISSFEILLLTKISLRIVFISLWFSVNLNKKQRSKVRVSYLSISSVSTKMWSSHVLAKMHRKLSRFEKKTTSHRQSFQNPYATRNSWLLKISREDHLRRVEKLRSKGKVKQSEDRLTVRISKLIRKKTLRIQINNLFTHDGHHIQKFRIHQILWRSQSRTSRQIENISKIYLT